MNIQYLHNREFIEELVPTDESEDFYVKEYSLSHFGGNTVAMQELDVNNFNLLEEGVKLTLMTGLSKCHPDDRYNKKEGRDRAHENMKPILLEVIDITINETGKYMTLRNNKTLYFLRKLKKCNRVHLIGVHNE